MKNPLHPIARLILERYIKAMDTQLQSAITRESQLFEKYYRWLKEHMSPTFFEEVEEERLLLITHHLMGIHLTGYFTKITLENSAIVLCANTPEADMKILQEFQFYGIKNYLTFNSDVPLPHKGLKYNLRVGLIYFTEINPQEGPSEALFSQEKRQAFYEKVALKQPDITQEAFDHLVQGINSRFVKALTEERLVLAIAMYFRALTRVNCQYEVIFNTEPGKRKKKQMPAIQIVLAWAATPKYRFLYRLAKLIYRHRLVLRRVNATYIDPYEKQNVLIMSLALDSVHGKIASADFDDFLKELVTLKYFEEGDAIEETFVNSGLLSGNCANFLRCAHNFAHQALVHSDMHLYSYGAVEEALCRHPELTVAICELFELKFSPIRRDLQVYAKRKQRLVKLIADLDTGQDLNDKRRKNVLTQCIAFIEYTLKTNFYRKNKTALGFRLHPDYLKKIPSDNGELFHEIPYGLFFIQGWHFISFHIRFKDLARGGLRTVFPKLFEQMQIDRDRIFSECYNLALTQQKKNKDIPEGGAKAVILLEPFEHIRFESEIYAVELRAANWNEEAIHAKLDLYREEQRLQYLYSAQKAFIDTLLTLINAEPSGKLKAKDIVDYYGKPEYIYLGPDENMHDVMVEWIANYSRRKEYSLGTAFITSKPRTGINHKAYGVTSLTVNVCMEEVLAYLEIDPRTDPFTLKMTGGPDGDVAGNEIMNLYRLYPKTAKLITLLDGTGLIHDPAGVDLATLATLFKKGQGICFFPQEKLSEGGWLLDPETTRQLSKYRKQVACFHKKNRGVVKEWLSTGEANDLLRHHVHKTEVDVFIPAGGRPRTLHEGNVHDFLDKKGKPTARAIIEGANLYLTPEARRILEQRGALIIKDSSANKGGVICSSFEVLTGLVMKEEEFLAQKGPLMKEILALIEEKAREEAQLILRTYCETGASLTNISLWISDRINKYTYEILSHLEKKPLPKRENDPWLCALFNYCPPMIRNHYREALLANVPDIHKKAIIACFIGSKVVYTRGLGWSPSIADVLPMLASDPYLMDASGSIDPTF